MWMWLEDGDVVITMGELLETTDTCLLSNSCTLQTWRKVAGIIIGGGMNRYRESGCWVEFKQNFINDVEMVPVVVNQLAT